MVTLVYDPNAHCSLDLERDGYGLSTIGNSIVEEALKTGKEIHVNNPYIAEACEIMARYLKHDVQYKDSKGEVKDVSAFYKIFARPLRELDLLRSSVDVFLAGGEDPFEPND